MEYQQTDVGGESRGPQNPFELETTNQRKMTQPNMEMQEENSTEIACTTHRMESDDVYAFALSQKSGMH